MFDDDEMENDEHMKCPKCGSTTTSYPDCPTYNRNGIVYRCTPTCGNTVTHSCTSWECYWSYTEDLNSMNQRYDQNLRNKPEWLLA